MWNVPEWAEITFYLLIPVVLLAFAAGVAWRVRKWFVGRAEPGAEKLRKQMLRRLLSGLRPRRLLDWVRTALFQARLSVRRFLPGHAPGDLLGDAGAGHRHGPGDGGPGLHEPVVRLPGPPRGLL